MLETLTVKNFALIDSLQLEFEPGLNVITGPTGSGKTLLLKALRLVLGERADYDLLQADSIQAVISAFFRLKQTDSVELAELAPDGEFQCRRLLKPNHQSPAYLNDERVRLEKLRKFRRNLIDFHGQHENQNVFDSDYPRVVLDRYGSYDDLLAVYREHYSRLKSIEKQINELNDKRQGIGQQKQFLSYQLEELEDFSPGENEWKEIEEKRRRMESSEEIDSYLRDSLKLINGQSSPPEQLARVGQLLAELGEYTDEFKNWVEEIDSIVSRLEDLRHRLHEVRESAGHSETEYNSLLDRRGTWMQLARKHNVPPEALYSHYNGLKEQLRELEEVEGHLERLRSEQKNIRQKVKELAGRLTEKREEVVAELEKEVSRRLRKLDLEKAEFEINIVEKEPGPSGCDRVEWLFSSHSSQPPDLLENRVSGGEISRVLLAIKAALARADTTPVLVFDEIDVGISGEEARSVGRVLSELAEYHQVFCITHLPLVSVYADRHLLVQRRDFKDRVEISARQLTGEDRIDELCRLLSGDEGSKVSRQQAEKLLKEVENDG